MDARHALNLTIQRITGQDIRLVGNWQPLPGLAEQGREIAEELGVSDRDLSRCRDIADILDLMGNPRHARECADGTPSLF